jgi:hypothetical protein
MVDGKADDSSRKVFARVIATLSEHANTRGAACASPDQRYWPEQLAPAADEYHCAPPRNARRHVAQLHGGQSKL